MHRMLKSMGFASMVMALALMAGCGSSKQADAGKAGNKKAISSATDAASRLDPAKLGALHNYRSVLITGMGSTRITIKTSVHSADNWQRSGPVLVRHIDGKAYMKLGDNWTSQADKADAYAKTNLPSFAKQFYVTTHVSHASVTRGKACKQANTKGHMWVIGADGGQTLSERFAACVADDSGALLKLVVGADGTATGEQHAREVYKIVSIGNVPAFSVPKVGN